MMMIISNGVITIDAAAMVMMMMVANVGQIIQITSTTAVANVVCDNSRHRSRGVRCGIVVVGGG